ncbi:MAG: flagellar hook-length control protein FliK [Janthinobacterium lividum]
MSADLAFRLTGFAGGGSRSQPVNAPTDTGSSSSFGGFLDTMARAITAPVAPSTPAGKTAGQAIRHVVEAPAQAPDPGVTVPGSTTSPHRFVSPSTTIVGSDEAEQAGDEPPSVAAASTTTTGAGNVDVATLAQAVLLATPAPVLPPMSAGTGAAAASEPAVASSPNSLLVASTIVDAVGAASTEPSGTADAASATAVVPSPSPGPPSIHAPVTPGAAQESTTGPASASALPGATSQGVAKAPEPQAAGSASLGVPALADRVAPAVAAATTPQQVAISNGAPLPTAPVAPRAVAARPPGAKPATASLPLAGSSMTPAAVASNTMASGTGTGTTEADTEDRDTSDPSEAAPDVAAQGTAATTLGPATIAPQAAAVDSTAAGQFASASQQVAAALSSLAGTAPESPAAVKSAAPATAAPRSVDTVGTVRTLPDGGQEVVVKLDPEHLGSVSIRLKMTGGKVDVAITVSDAHTLDVLNRDRHVLSAAVASASLSGDGLTLEHGTVETKSATPGTSTPNDQPGPMPDGRGSASASGNSSGGHRRRDPRPSSSATRDDAADAGLPIPDATRTGALYV